MTSTRKTIMAAMLSVLLPVSTQAAAAAPQQTHQHTAQHQHHFAPAELIPDPYAPGARAVRTPRPLIPLNMHDAYPRADM